MKSSNSARMHAIAVVRAGAHSRHLLLTLLLVFTGLTVIPAHAVAAPPHKVFKEPPSAVKPGRHGTLAIKGKVNNQGVKNGTNSLIIELPDGSSVELDKKSFKQLKSGNFTWRGKAKGHQSSEVTLSIIGERMAGRLRVDDDVYEIRPEGEGEIRVEWLDMESFPACDGGVLVDIPATDGDEVSINLASMAAAVGDEATHEIGLLVLYDQGAENEAGAGNIQAIIASAVATLNTAFINSGMTARAVLLHTQKIDHSEPDINTYLDWLAADPEVAALRNQYGADLVSVIGKTSGCGLGQIQRTTAENFSSAVAFQVTEIGCAVGNQTFAHETGHNMGMEHNPGNSSVGGTPYYASYDHSFGHWVTGGSNPFRTVMSYSNPCGSSCPRIEHFSNPAVNYQATATGITSSRDNAQTGDFTAPVISLYRNQAQTSGSQIFEIEEFSDDAQEWNLTRTVGLSWTSIFTGYYPGSSPDATTIGLRFQAINIPQDATVTAAWLEFEPMYDGSGYSASTISVENSDDPLTFSTDPGNITTRTKGSSILWDNIPDWTVGNTYQSVDISQLVQESVDRDGWVPNNSIAFIIDNTTGHRVATAYEALLSPSTAPHLHIEHRSCNESIALTGGAVWQMFSLPCLPRDSEVTSVFTGLNSAEYDATWAIFSYDASTGSYTKLAATDSMQSNVGYWYINSGTDYTLSVSGKESRSTDINLQTGPGANNLVGHTSLDTIPWDEVKVIDGASELTLTDADPDLGNGLGLACDQNPVDTLCVMSRKMYQWNGAVYQTFDGNTLGLEGSVSKFNGLWVKAYKPGLSLRIPKTAPAGDAGGKGKAADGAWSLQLTVESGEQSDPGNVLGQLTDSDDGKDAHDLPELAPYGNSWLTLLFLNQAWEQEGNWGYTSDFRAVTRKPAGEWRFVVRGSGEQEEATLRWNGPTNIVKKARLIDEATGKSVRLKQTDSYTFPLNDGEHYFRLVVK